MFNERVLVIDVWVRLLLGQQLLPNGPPTLSLLSKTFSSSSWPACGSTYCSWGRCDLLYTLPPLQILNSSHFLHINSKLCFQQLSGSHPDCNPWISLFWKEIFSAILIDLCLFLKGLHVILAPMSKAWCRAQGKNLFMNRYGVHNKDHVQCSCTLPPFWGCPAVTWGDAGVRRGLRNA